MTLESPATLLLALSHLTAVIAIATRYGHTSYVRKLTTPHSAIIQLIIGALALSLEGTLGLFLHTTIPFAFYLLILQTTLILTIYQAIKHHKPWTFTAIHLGILLIIYGAYWGAPDVTRAKLMLTPHWPQNTAYTTDGHNVPLPFTLQLTDFHIDYYDDHTSPRQYTSHLLADTTELTTSVNAPATYRGYTILQSGYDRQAQRYTILQIVREPWLPLVYLGMALLALGSLRQFIGTWRPKITIPTLIILTIAFTIFSIAKINFSTLMPALRSWWFVPHLFLYMVAYSLMAMSLISRLSQHRYPQLQSYTHSLFRSSSALLIIGMLTGAVWARQAWGDYWSWDAKENWAATTWLLSLIPLHLSNHRSSRYTIVLLLTFLALQITWYGVNYLPAAKDSLHTYNL